MPLNVLLWLARPSAEGRELENALGPALRGGRLETFGGLDDLEARLRGPKTPPELAIIWGPDAAQLRALETRRGLLDGLRLILVLPDDRAETIALSHRLRPAYVSYVDEGTSGIVAVAARLAAIPGGGPLDGIA